MGFPRDISSYLQEPHFTPCINDIRGTPPALHKRLFQWVNSSETLGFLQDALLVDEGQQITRTQGLWGRLQGERCGQGQKPTVFLR